MDPIRTRRSNGATDRRAMRVPSRWRLRNWQNRGGEGGLGTLRVEGWMRQASGSAESRSRFSSRTVQRVRTISFSAGWWTLDTSAPRSSPESSATICFRRNASIAVPFYAGSAPIYNGLMPSTDAPGFRMAYEVRGTGLPLLLINGLGRGRREWVSQGSPVERHFRVGGFHHPGAREEGA